MDVPASSGQTQGWKITSNTHIKASSKYLPIMMGINSPPSSVRWSFYSCTIIHFCRASWLHNLHWFYTAVTHWSSLVFKFKKTETYMRHQSAWLQMFKLQWNYELAFAPAGLMALHIITLPPPCFSRVAVAAAVPLHVRKQAWPLITTELYVSVLLFSSWTQSSELDFMKCFHIVGATLITIASGQTCQASVFRR